MRSPFLLLPLFILAVCSCNRSSQTQLSPKEKFYHELKVKEVRVYASEGTGNVGSTSLVPSLIERYSRDGQKMEEVQFLLRAGSEPTFWRRVKTYQLSDKEKITFTVQVTYNQKEFMLTKMEYLKGNLMKSTVYKVTDVDVLLLDKLSNMNLVGITESTVIELGNPVRVEEYKYNRNDAITQQDVYEGDGENSEPQPWTTTTYHYKDDLLVRKVESYVETNTISRSDTFTYNNNDSLLSHITRSGNGTMLGRVIYKYDTLGFRKIESRYIEDDSIAFRKVFSYRSADNLNVDSTLYYSTNHNYLERVSDGLELSYTRRSDDQGQAVSVQTLNFYKYTDIDTLQMDATFLENGLLDKLVGYESVDGSESVAVYQYEFYK